MTSETTKAESPALLEVNPLVGRHVYLRPIYPEDYGFLHRIETSGPLAVRWRQGGLTPSPENFASRLWDGVLAQYFVVDNASDELVGIASLYFADMQNRFCHIAFARFGGLRSGRRLLEGALLLIDYAFRRWGFRKLYGETIEYNYAQFRSGAGRLFREEARIPNHEYLDGQYWDRYILAIYQHEWEERAANLLALVRPSPSSGDAQ